MKINPNNPATGFGYANQHSRQEYIGLTIRAQIAAMAMQGLLADSNNFGTGDANATAIESVAYADALIKELNKTK